MSQARDLLTLLLYNAPTQELPPNVTIPPGSLTASNVSKPPPIQSVQTFNTQLVIGGKDLALRKAASLFKAAADRMEKGRASSEAYWVDALKIRKDNWGLIPAPLPPGSATGKGADRSSKDFLISFGLEESPPVFRRRAIACIPYIRSGGGILEFPGRQHNRLQVSILSTDEHGQKHTARNYWNHGEERSGDASLRAAQAEVVQQEIFAMLIREASNFPTASARVSERLVAVEATENMDLRFELVDNDLSNDDASSSSVHQATCDSIFAALHLLLLRAHSFLKSKRLGRVGIAHTLAPGPDSIPPPILQPVIDMLQYQAFCDRVYQEIDKVVQALHRAGVPTKVHLREIGESGAQLVSLLQNDDQIKVGGECLLRIEQRHTMRFTFNSPSTLIAHLPQATLPIATIFQLSQLLVDEVTGCLLQRICDIGTELSEHVQGSWFVDHLAGRSVGRWEGQVLNFEISSLGVGAVHCTAAFLSRSTGPSKNISEVTESYNSEKAQRPLLDWARDIIHAALPHT
ncbi:unnamed protein product [Somion occarium]